MGYRNIISLCFFLALILIVFILYRRSFIFFWLYALRAGLDRGLTGILENLVRRHRIRPPSRVFGNPPLLDRILKTEIKSTHPNSSWQAAAADEYILNLYKIKQVVDLRDHAPHKLSSTVFLPSDAEIYVLQYKLRIAAEIISNERRTFSLFIPTNAENEKTYIPEFTVKEGESLELVYSVGIMEEYHFSSKIKSLKAVSNGLQVILLHTKEISSLFYRRYREKKADIRNIRIERLFHHSENDNLSKENPNEIFEGCYIVSVSMAGCILRTKHPCEEGLHIALGFSVHNAPAVYYGRLGKAYKEHGTKEDSYLVEVQFIQSTKTGLSNLGELVYEFRGT